MKKVKFILQVVFFVVLFCGLISTNHRINELKAMVEGKEEQKVEVIKQVEEEQEVQQTEEIVRPQIIIECDNSEFMQMLFPTDGNYYVEATGMVTFYSDPKCENEISTPRFLSGERQYYHFYTWKDGFDMEIYCLLAEDGTICYCPGHKTPKLLTEAEYEAYKARNAQ